MELRCERGISLKMDSSFLLFLLPSLELAEHPGKEAKGKRYGQMAPRNVPMPTFSLTDNGVPSLELNNGSVVLFAGTSHDTDSLWGTNMLSL